MKQLPSRSRGYTLVEVLVVAGVVVLILGIATPLLRVFRENRSVEGAVNQLSAMVNAARNQAMRQQRYGGLLFYYDTTQRRVYATLVYAPDLDTASVAYLDMVPDADVWALAPGILVQTSISQGGEKYLGFNSVGGGTTLPVGGIILFDGRGQAVTSRCGLQLKNGTTTTNLAALLGATSPTANTVLYPGPSADGGAIRSQMSIAVLDEEKFRNGCGLLGGGRDPMIDPVSTGAPDTYEATEETWITANATILTVSRYNGTLMKGN